MSNWDELNQAEEPAAEFLQSLGWQFVPAERLDNERASARDVLLLPRLEAAIRRLNPWISEDNIKRVVRIISTPQATNLLEANEQLYNAMTYSVSVTQDTGDGMGVKSRSVHLLAFNPEQTHLNEFVFTRQFSVQNIKNQHIIPDIVLFVNGLPLAILECKSPKITDPVGEGIKQLTRYQELEDRYMDRGAPKLFETVQVLASLCGIKAHYGTVGTPKAFWSEWKSPYPLSLDEFEKRGFNSHSQNVLLYGLFRPENLLDLIQNFIVFEVDGGRSIKKLARYQQFIAVNESIQRITHNEGQDRGGIVWHTQGSGKSLTMVYLATKLRRLTALDNPTLVIVTDRTDLDRQITKTFNSCGFPNPEQATRIQHLRELLVNHTGKTILTTVQKFGGFSDEITAADNIFVLVDEAHRTQYKTLAARMRAALPYACFLGFTGTPIDKNDRSTHKTFGSYIHTYTIEEAVKDGATVPIFYEGRLPELFIVDASIDTILKRVFADNTEEELEEIKRRYATEEAIAGSPDRIKKICLDILEHFEKYIHPNGYKAQIVAVNRETAVLYKETLDSLNAPKSALIMSFNHNDPAEYKALATKKEDHKSVIEDQFKKKNDPLSILIVCDMLLTGFDAPIEQVMYLDSPLKEHTLLQAIARVNRKADDTKTYGLIVDYWGVSENLQDALKVFNPQEIEGALKPKSDELPRLESRHQAVLRFFKGKKRDDMEGILRVIEPEDVRAEFDQAFKRFASSLDMVLPDPSGLKFMTDMRWLSDIRLTARNRFRDDTLDLTGCAEKVKKLIEEYVRTIGIQSLMEPLSIFSQEFDEAVEALGSPEAKASEMEHALKHEISVKLKENPVIFKSLKERLEAIIEARKQATISAVEQLKLFASVRDDLRNIHKQAANKGMSEDQYAFYSLLNESSLGSEQAEELSGLILENLQKLVVIDWQDKEDVQREMRRQIKRYLRIANIKDNIEETTSRLIDLARARLS
ncbi:MAG: type I restriction endonuclease subunit R [Vampirovibrionales bacterium]|nr:type I restriction endonuclease subunit R [Vampirovibrionales bacterium]